MAEQNQFDWATVVQQKWPKITKSAIKGSGPFILKILCGPFHSAHLYETYTAVIAAMNSDCDSKVCTRKHSWEKLERPAPRVIRRAHWIHQIEEPA